MDAMKESDEFTRRDMLAEFESRVIKKNDDWYFADREYVTNSMLSELDKSPEHLEYYLKSKEVQEEEPEEEKQAFIEGHAFDCAVLEPNDFKKRFFVLDDTIICHQIGGAKPRGTNRYKEWKNDVLFENEDKQLISIDIYNDIMRMQDKLYAIAEIRNLLEISLKQVIMHDSIKLNHDIPAIKRKIKMDCVRPGDFIMDLKGSRDNSNKFIKSFYNYQYNRQGSYYSDVAKIPNVLFLHVEKSKPHSIGLIRMSESALEIGREKYMNLLHQYHKFFVRREVADLSQFILRRTV